MGKIELINKLKERGKKALMFAKELGEKEEYGWGIFMLEQSLQLLLKAKILEFFPTFPKIHNLKMLIEILSEKIPEIKNFKERVEIDLLNDAYVHARYEISEYGKESFEKCLRVVEELWKILK